MLKILKIALRNIRKNRGFSLINMMGLTIGIVCFLLLLAYVYHELNYDRYLSNSKRISLITSANKADNDEDFSYWAVTPTAIAPTFVKEFPEIERAVRMYNYNDAALVQQAGQTIKESQLKYVDEDFLKVLDFDIIIGNAKNPLANPNDIVLTEKLAKKYFPDGNPIGKTLVVDKTPWMVSAVIKDLPTYTEIKFSALLSNKGLQRYKDPIWGSANDLTFALLKENVNKELLQKKIDALVAEQFKEAFASGSIVKINLENLEDIHLRSKAAGSGNMTYIYIFGFLAVILLLVSTVNFTNLSLSHATERAKEIAVRKILGAGKKTLFMQFIVEGGVKIGLALVLGILVTWLLFPIFSAYIGVPMKLGIGSKPLFYISILGFFVLLNFMASGWPAWIIARFNPINVVKGQLKSGKSKFSIDKVLIAFQYCISIFMVICTLFAYQQMQFIQTMNTGLNRSQIIVLDGDLWDSKNQETLKSELIKLKSIRNVTASYDSPVNIKGGYEIQAVEGKAVDFKMNITAIPIEKDFLTTFEIPIIAGENLNDTDIIRSQDTSENKSVSIIINKLAAKKLGWSPEEAIGKKVNLNGRTGPIKAVVDDFNFASLREDVQPVALFPEYHYFGNIFLKLNLHANTQQAIQEIEAVFKRLKPDAPFEYHFLDDDYTALYKQEQQTTKITQLFALVTICIACIGLFAISAYATQQRVKEIGIRKVLGASTGKLVALLTSGFVKLVIIAFFIAVPFGYWVIDKWLNNFAYHINMEWWIFVTAGCVTLVISFITISNQAFRAANANPVDSLRDE